MLTSSRYDVKIKAEFIEGERKTYSAIEYDNPVEYNFTSRYKNARRVIEGGTTREYHETVDTQEVIDTDDDRFVTVENTTENRLDIIAYEKYGSPKYWWVIAIANDLEDSFDVPRGTVLRIPPLTSLYVDGGVLDV